MRDTMRKAANIIGVASTIYSIYFWYYDMMEECYFVSYIGTSMYFLFLTLSFHRNRTKENAVLYSIIRHSKYAKKIITKTIKQKIYEGEEGKQIDGKVVYFTENCKPVGKSTAKSGGSAASIISAASVFLDMPFSEALELCCKPFRLDGENKIKIVHKSKMIEYVKITDGWFEPGPSYQDIYVNNTKKCVYNSSCKDELYTVGVDICWYVMVALIVYVIFKTINFLVKLFRTPIMVETSEFELNRSNSISSIDTMEGGECHRLVKMPYSSLEKSREVEGLKLRKIMIQKNIYVSKFRIALAVLYLCLMAYVCFWSNQKYKLFAGADAEVVYKTQSLVDYDHYIDGLKADKLDVITLLIKTGAIDSTSLKKYLIDTAIEIEDVKRSKRDTSSDKKEDEKNDVQVQIENQQKTKDSEVGVIQDKVNTTYTNKLRIVDIGFLDETGKDEASVVDEGSKCTITGTPKGICSKLESMKGIDSNKSVTLKVQNVKQEEPEPQEEPLQLNLYDVINNKIKDNGKDISNQEIEGIVNNLDIDEFVLNEDSVFDLTCIYDEVLYVTTGSVKAKCHIDHENPGKIMIGKIFDEYNVKNISDICYSNYNLQLARIGKPNCIKVCNQNKDYCDVEYRPNNNVNIPIFSLNKGYDRLTADYDRYEEFKIYFPLIENSVRAKRNVVGSVGNIYQLSDKEIKDFVSKNEEKFSDYEKRLQDQQDKNVGTKTAEDKLKNMGYRLIKPAEDFEGKALDIKRENAKTWVSKYGDYHDQQKELNKEYIKEKIEGNKDALKVKEVKKEDQESVDIVSIEMKGSINRFGVGTYISKRFVTQFDKTFSGSIFLAEKDDGKCDTAYGDRYSSAACSRGRRQIISCEPDLWGDFTYGNSFKCREPTDTEKNKIPQWRLSDPKIEYSMPKKQEARLLDSKSSDTVIEFDENTYAANVSILWGRTYQDNIQQVGSLKYFVYSFMVRVEIKNNMKGADNFASGWNKEIDYFNRWKSRKFDNVYTLYKSGPMNKSNNVVKLPKSIIEIVKLPTPVQGNDMLQDRSYVNAVIKSDVYDRDMVKMSPDSVRSCSPSPSSPCVYVMPVYYAIRLYGPAKAKVKLFGIDIEEIAFSKDVCSSGNAISVKGICYMFDETQSSTDVMVGGYPWSDWSGLGLYTWLESMEIPSFYLNHPKIGSGQYLSKVSTTANIGAFSAVGRCSDTYYKDKTLMCDGNKAANIDMVEYSTFHRPLTSMPNCTIKQHDKIRSSRVLICKTTDNTLFTVCDHNPHGKLLYKKDCDQVLTKKLVLNIHEGTGLTVTTPNVVYQLQKGYEPGTTKLHYLMECWYRSTVIVTILLLLSGIGYIMIVIHVLATLICYVNSYNIGKLLRALNLGWLFNKQPVQVCNICENNVYNDIERNKHALCCKKYWCPYCITYNKEDQLCSLEFGNRNSYRHHSKIHRNIRTNPYSGYIGVRRQKVVAFHLVPMMIICFAAFGQINTEIVNLESGLRSNRIGTSVMIPESKLKCDNTLCSIISTERASVPLVDGSSIVLKGKVKENEYAKKITIKNPKLVTSCVYEYSSSFFKRGNKRIVYSCTGKSDCNSVDQQQMLLQPVGGNAQEDEFYPIDPSNPLKSLNCPKAVACRSPIVNFMWMAAGCFSVNDGTAIGYEYYMPDIKKPMVNVFKCKVTDMTYSVCDDKSCKEIKGQEEGVEAGELRYEHLTNHLPVEFNIGVVASVGAVTPNHIFHDLPNVGATTTDTMLAYRLNKIPQGDTCLEGTEYNGGSCDINEAGASPNLICKATVPEPSMENMAKQYESLSDVYHCNFEESVISWNVGKISRETKIKDQRHVDDQTYSWPSINLLSKNCMFGYTDIDLMSMDHLSLDVVKYAGNIKSVTCSGYYNRNQKTRLVFALDSKEGLIDFKCDNSFTDTCVFDTRTTNECNVTTLLPFSHKCKYGTQIVDVDCSKLELAEADPTSGHSIGWTGSTAYMTWPGGIKIMLTNWWGMGLLIVSAVFGIILILWLTHVFRTMLAANAVAKMTGQKIRHHNDNIEHIVLDEDVYNSVIKKETDENNDGNMSIRNRINSLSASRYNSANRTRGYNRVGSFD
nr:GPC [Aphid bunyavirus 1]